MDIIGLVVFVMLLCFLLWVVNASGWTDLPPPLKMGITLLLIVVLILGALQISGVYSFREIGVRR